MRHVPEIKLIRTDTTLDLSQKAEKVWRLQFSRGLSRVARLCHTYGLNFTQQLQVLGTPKYLRTRTHGATAARRIPDPKAGGSNPSGFTFFFLQLANLIVRSAQKICFGNFLLLPNFRNWKVRADKRSPGTDTYLICNPSHFEHLPGRPWVLIKQDTGVVWSRALALWLLWSAIGMLNALADGVICCCNDFLSQH